MLMRKQRVLNFAVGAVALMATTAITNAASLVTFDALPTTSTLPEFQFTNEVVPHFTAGAGATGNGNSDGLLDRSAQLPGGLGIQTPLHVLGASAKPLDNGGTAFDDVTLVLSDLAASGPATGPDANDVIDQPLGQANPLAATPTFSLYATSLLDSNPLHGQLLLTGTITKASITALNEANTASVLSSKVTYTGGAIFDALVAINGTTTTGSLSWSLLDVRDGSPTVSINPATNLFTPFLANGSGLFSTPTVPEPTSAAILGLPALAMLVQRRRTMRA
jgi:hypothetical protein